jgi:hypothetical protein
VTIIGQKILKSGQVLNLIAPFTKFSSDDSVDGYSYGSELDLAIQRCDWEVSEYLFSEKYGVKQEQLDFESDAPVDANIEPKKKGKGRKKMNIEEAKVFDETA